MSSPPPPDRWQSDTSTPHDVHEPDPDDADTGPLPAQMPRLLPAEERWHAGQGAWADKFDAPLIVNPRRVRHHERKPIVFLGVVSLLIVLVVGGLMFWLVRPSSGTTSAPPPSDAPTTQSPDTDRLLRLVPAGYPADACKPISAPKYSLAQVNCGKNSDQGGPLTATYALVENKAALDVAFNNIIVTSTRVNCPGNIQSPGPWRRNATPDKTSGTLSAAFRPTGPLSPGRTTPDCWSAPFKGVRSRPHSTSCMRGGRRIRNNGCRESLVRATNL